MKSQLLKYFFPTLLPTCLNLFRISPSLWLSHLSSHIHRYLERYLTWCYKYLTTSPSCFPLLSPPLYPCFAFLGSFSFLFIPFLPHLLEEWLMLTVPFLHCPLPLQPLCNLASALNTFPSPHLPFSLQHLIFLTVLPQLVSMTCSSLSECFFSISFTGSVRNSYSTAVDAPTFSAKLWVVVLMLSAHSDLEFISQPTPTWLSLSTTVWQSLLSLSVPESDIPQGSVFIHCFSPLIYSSGWSHSCLWFNYHLYVDDFQLHNVSAYLLP